MKNKRKEKSVAYILGALAGQVGAHKFYLDKPLQGFLHLIPIAAVLACDSFGVAALSGLVIFSWWVYDLVKLSDEVDEYNGDLEPEIPSQPSAPDAADPCRNAAIPPAADGKFVNTKGNSIDFQLKRANSLLQLNIVNPQEFGMLSASIASGEFVLSQSVYHDVVNLNSMKERHSIDEFMYEMQKSQILGFKYLK